MGKKKYTLLEVVGRLKRNKLKVTYVTVIDANGHKRVTEDIKEIRVRKNQTVGIKLLGMIDFLDVPIVREGK